MSHSFEEDAISSTKLYALCDFLSSFDVDVSGLEQEAKDARLIARLRFTNITNINARRLP